MLGSLWSVLWFLAGCGSTQSPHKQQEVQGPAPPVTILVVGNPMLAEQIARLESEWRGQARFGLNVQAVDSAEFQKRAQAGQLRADAVVLPYVQFPYLAELVGLESIPRSVLEDPRGQWTGIFGTLRVRQLRWAERPVAVPLGVTVFVLYLRRDLLDELEAKPPTTWQEYQKLAEKLARIRPLVTSPQQSDRNQDDSPGGTSESSGQLEEAAGSQASSNVAPATGQEPGGKPSVGEGEWFGVLEPIGPGWGGRVLLARAAAYITHRDHFSTFFSIDDMRPLIDQEPFVRALEELRAAARLGPAEIVTYSPAEVRRAFWQGKCGMAISCPTATHEGQTGEVPLAVAFAELPGSAEVYDLRRGQWEKRRREEPWQIPLIGLGGWVGAIPKGSDRKQDAFQVLFWLSREQATEVAGRLPDCTLYRNEHMTQAKRWVDQPAPDAAAIELALIVRQMLEKPVALLAIGIPGTEEYLRALDEAVAATVRGELSAREALVRAREEWEAINKKWGQDKQLQAYRHSMNLP